MPVARSKARRPAPAGAWAAARARRSRRPGGSPPAAARRTAPRARASRPGRGRRPALRARPDQAVAAAQLSELVARAVAVVLDRQHQLVRLVRDHHARLGVAGVLQRVGERLLHDPVGGEVDARGQGHALSLHVHVHAQPGRAGAGGELLHAVDADGPLEVLALAVAHRSEQAPQLCQGLAPGALDQLGHLGRLLRALLHDPPGPAGLHHHHAQVVGEHVVQLARDA